jgi:cytochrome c oxidase cbb3-type subunit IV
MRYEDVAHFAQTAGLVLLVALFVAAAAFALWPGNRARFQRAARLPLDEE